MAFPEHLILFDSTGFNYYRVMATIAWAKRDGIQPLSDNDVFLSNLKGQYFGCLNKFFKLYQTETGRTITLKDCWSIRDCPREEIWRRQFYPEYKAHRDQRETTVDDDSSLSLDIGPFLKYLYDATSHYFDRCLRVAEMEADDTIATLVRITRDLPYVKTISIVTLDSDFYQLLADPRVSVYHPKPNWRHIDKTPEEALYLLEQKISAGDATDNIKSASQMASMLGDSYAGYNFNARLVDFDYIPRILVERVASAIECTEEQLPVNYRPRDIQLGLCCLNTILRDQNIFCSRKAIIKTIETKGHGELFRRCQENLMDLIRMIDWNGQNGIRVFRISSELFPHYANPKVARYSLDQFQPLLTEAGRRARKYGQRLTFHPGQYNVVGTPDPVKFQNTAMELDYHAEVLDRLGCDNDSVMVVHGGGQYGNKTASIDRWIAQFRNLSPRVQRRLVLENCEKSFNIEDCLYISSHTGVPVVFDTHHYDCYRIIHPEVNLQPPDFYIPYILATWAHRKIKPKFHISEQGPKQIGNHSDYIESIPNYLLNIPSKFGIKIDIMVEAKMKEQAIFQLYRKYPEISPFGTATPHVFSIQPMVSLHTIATLTVPIIATPTVPVTVKPTVTPTVQVTVKPTVTPTVQVTVKPTVPIIVTPTVPVTVKPTVTPTVPVTVKPTVPIIVTPTVPVTVKPTVTPTVPVTVKPTVPIISTPTVPVTVKPTVPIISTPIVPITVKPTVTPTVPMIATPTVPITVKPTVPMIATPTVPITVKTMNVTPTVPINIK